MDHDSTRSALRTGRSDVIKHACGGFTLIEVILVLALLVVIAAVSVPIIEGSFTRARLQHGGDLVRAAWTRARLAAAESGTTRAFRFEQGGSRYQVITLDTLGAPDAGSLQPEVLDTERSDADIARLGQSRLPEGIVFAGGNISGSNQLAATLAPAADGLGWSTPILFYADGRTSDASLLLANDRQQTLRVTLRGVTGTSRAGEVGNEAAP